ncbi:MAG: bacillithiol biosynthesis cysteine-adding enzyme BshC [Ignavibacteriae bacterium]|nr:bacillithiol biosynthesis cysteine-adding enzyme BshC [Ignavibacteriota bacterium]
MFINFSDVPGNSNLFLDYVYEFENVKQFYNLNFRNEESYSDVFNFITDRDNSLRKNISGIIENQYHLHAPSEKTMTNIIKLKDENTIAILTGQQLGLAGGPLYTVYKIFTAIKLSENLKEKFTNYNFVPIFWLAGDDHDIEEISELKLVSKENLLRKIKYNFDKDEKAARHSVGNLQIDASIKEFYSEIKDSLRETEFSKELYDLLDDILTNDKTLAESFQTLLFKIFDETGLIIFNPQDVEVKKLLKPIFAKELNNYHEHSKSVLSVSANLEENYHTQVKVKPINLFMSDKTGRRLIEPIENGFRLKGKRTHISKDEMLKFVDEKPENFSGNVLLRPICQDYLFPTGFYIAGPGEINYFAQAIPLYKHFKVQQPFIYPRSSATIIEGNISKILVKNNIGIKEIFLGGDELNSKVIHNISEENVETIFEEFTGSIKDNLSSLSEKLNLVDRTLGDVADNSKNKIIHQLETLKAKAKKLEENKYDIAIRQMDKAKSNLYPNNNLQERELSVINFINKYGLDFFDWLYNELEINEFEHQILEL